jgi:hypothetical protein
VGGSIFPGANGAARAFLFWFSLPQLGDSDNFLEMHPHGGWQNDQCPGVAEIVQTNPISEWLRIPLDPSSYRFGSVPSGSKMTMDWYLDSHLGKHETQLFSKALQENQLWCGHLAFGRRYVGGFAELASMRIAREMVKFFFRPEFSERCRHHGLTGSGEPTIMWDPRYLLPTEAGKTIRGSLLHETIRLSGPHALLRATEGFFPDLVPIGVAAKIDVRAFFEKAVSHDVELSSVGGVVRGNCEVKSSRITRTLMKVFVREVLRVAVPFRRLVPESLRAIVRDRLKPVLGAPVLSEGDMSYIASRLGFSPVPITLRGV